MDPDQLASSKQSKLHCVKHYTPRSSHDGIGLQDMWCYLSCKQHDRAALRTYITYNVNTDISAYS